MKYLKYLPLLVLLWMSCKKDKDAVPVEYPQFIAPDENFEVLNDTFYVYGSTTFGCSKEDANCENTDTISISAKFNQKVSWVLTITGQESGAEKTFEGTGSSIDSTVTMWFGASDNINFFRKGESLEYNLSFYSSNYALTADTSNIGAKATVVEKRDFANANCYVIGEFEGDYNVKDPSLNPDLAPAWAEPEYSASTIVTQWNKFFDVDEKNEEICGGEFNLDERFSGSNCNGDSEKEDQFRNSLPTPVQGRGLFYLWGKDRADQPSTFFIGGMNHDPVSYNINAPLESIYLNFYANSNGNKTTLVKPTVFGVGADEFSQEVTVDWDGWKLVSIRLSDLALSQAGEGSPGYLDPSFIKQVGFNLMSAGQAGNEAFIAIDYVTMTIGAPFNQNYN